MKLKRSYKIIISIIIVAILISSMVIYFYPHNNTEYYNNGQSINLKYFTNDSGDRLLPNHYHVSSYYNTGSKFIYLNTSVEPLAFNLPSFISCACVPVNLTSNQINTKYVYVIVTGTDDCIVYGGEYNGSIKQTSKGEQYTGRLDYNSNMNFIVKVIGISSYLNNNYYNFTIKVSAGKLTNTYYIATEKESAVYGDVCISPTNPSLDKINTQILIENDNTSTFHIVNINDGYYYYFVESYTPYTLYSLNTHNNTLEIIGNIGSSNVPAGESYRYNLYGNQIET